MSLSVTKMSGTQNTFFILDARAKDFDLQWHQKALGLSRSQFARKLCHSSHFSKADGCIYIEKDPFLDFRWDFYNSDGSSAQMCGNAARCVCQLAYDQKWTKLPSVKFRSDFGIIKADVLSKGFVRVKMNAPQILEPEKTLTFQNQVLKGLNVNTGVPHFVMKASHNDFHNKPSLKEIAKYVRCHPYFGLKGCNVSWVLVPQDVAHHPPSFFKGLTFERGVENFTPACGTGAVAMAVFLISRGLQPFGQDITIRVPGGDLIVNISRDYKQATLSGAVEYLEQFELQQSQMTFLSSETGL